MGSEMCIRDRLKVVRRYSGAELWRLGEDTQENLDMFNAVNPHATDADRARAAGDGITRRYASAVMQRTLRRMRRYVAAKRRLVATRLAIKLQTRWRGARARAGAERAARGAPGGRADVKRVRFEPTVVDGSHAYALKRAAGKTRADEESALRPMRQALAMLAAQSRAGAGAVECAGGKPGTEPLKGFQRRGPPVSPA